MILWGAMLIPFVAMLVLVWFYSKKLVWWEYALIILIPFFTIWITKVSVEMSQTSATEFLGGWMDHVEYHEYWKEWYHETCSETYACGSDSKGNTRWCTRYYDCSHYEAHAAYWQAYDSNGNSWPISPETFDQFVKLFGNKTFVDLKGHPGHDMTRSGCVNGDEYDTNIPDPYTDDQLVITSVPHTYVNKVQASKSVFNFPKVDPKKVHVMDRPKIEGWNQDVILGDAGPTKAAGEKTIGKIDGTLGKASKARIYVLAFKNRPMQAAFDQQAYWKNGHKNEVDICVGVNDAYEVQWSRVFGWTKEETLKSAIQDHLMDQKILDLGELGTWLYPQIKGKTIRRDFKEFDYVTIDPPAGWVMFNYIFTLLLCIAIGWFEVNQDLGEQPKYPWES